MKLPIKPNSKRIAHKQIYQGAIIDLGLETVRLNATSSPANFEVVRHPGGAAVVALDEKLRVCLLKQYRYAVDQWLWELPAGKIDDLEAPEKTSVRELAEEAGLSAKKWTPLGSIVSSPGILDEVLYLYMAQELTSIKATPQEHELIETHWFKLNDAVEMALNGEINDAKSIVALLRAQALIKQ